MHTLLTPTPIIPESSLVSFISQYPPSASHAITGLISIIVVNFCSFKIIYKMKYIVCTCSFLASFTQHNIFKIHLCRYTYHQFGAFYRWVEYYSILEILVFYCWIYNTCLSIGLSIGCPLDIWLFPVFDDYQ